MERFITGVDPVLFEDVETRSRGCDVVDVFRMRNEEGASGGEPLAGCQSPTKGSSGNRGGPRTGS